ncbi:NAD kinase [Nitrospira tepida]|uniref:NAD kinase n=1 Tax=Nitrospira tepida TaxID=2973512 RepID=A0AA86MZT6_9BACT|nr:NAD(+)/NADH kinase [Nitrospira tepida]CAI4032066.1 NAD kinase [Nitrospira tepida]
MKRIGILTKPKFPDVAQTLHELCLWLRHRQKDVLLESSTAALIDECQPFDRPTIAREADMIIVLGGDGTMLGAARLVAARNPPILGVNMGGLGFLTEVTVDHLFDALERVFRDDFAIDERLMLSATMERAGEVVMQSTALNDVVISKGTLARMIETQVGISGQFVTNLRGDGLIVSTPTGSTGYALSAGGPIVSPAASAFMLAPICPHTLTHRPLIVPSTVSISISLSSKDAGAMVTLDGQEGMAMQKGDVVIVTASDHRTHLIRFPERTYYETLRLKLKWGDG